MPLKKILLLKNNVNYIKDLFYKLIDQESINLNILNELEKLRNKSKKFDDSLEELKKENVKLKEKIKRTNAELGKMVLYQEALKKLCINMSKDIELLSTVLSKVLVYSPIEYYDSTLDSVDDDFYIDEIEINDKDEVSDSDIEEFEIDPDSFSYKIPKNKKKVYH